jgi:hypothetical protein
MLRTSRKANRHVAVLSQIEAGSIFLVADVTTSKSRTARLLVGDRMRPEDAIARVRELADTAANAHIDFSVWEPLEGSDAAAITVPVDLELRGAGEEKQAQACLARTPWSDAVILDEDLYIEYLARSHRIHFAAVRGAILDARERQLEGLPVVQSPLSHALVALLDRAHPEVFMAKGPMTLAILCLPRSLAAVVAARGELLLVTQFDLTQLILGEASSLREGQAAPFNYRRQMPQTSAELETLVYHRVLESAFEHVRRILLEKGENPEALRRVYFAGEAVATYEVADYLSEVHGPALEIRPILATKVCQMFANSEEEREQARHIVANEALYASAFAMLAMAMSMKPVAFQTAVPEPANPSRASLRTPAALSSPSVLVGLGSALFLFVVCFMSYFWYLGFQIDDDRAAYAQEEKQREIYREYGAKRAELEGRAAHIRELVRLVDSERQRQRVPLEVTDDIDRAMRSIPGVNSPGDPRSRLEWQALTFDGRTVTVTGTARYRDNAVAFGEALGALDERKTFTGVDTKWRERGLPASEETPEGDVTYDFTITATFNPQPAAN